MTEQVVTVSNRAGIHARPAAVLVQAVKDFKASIYFERGKDRINAKSIMGILTLAAAYKSDIRIIADGEDEKQAVEIIVRLFQSNFDEE